MSKKLKVGDRVKIADAEKASRFWKLTNSLISSHRKDHYGEIGETVAFVSDCYNVLIGDRSYWWPSVLLTKLPDENEYATRDFGEEAFRRAAGQIAGSVFAKSMEAVATVEPPKCVPLKCRCVVDPAPKTHNTKPAEIVFDHVVVDGKCMLKIAEINGISVPSELPDEYKRGYPAMWEGSGNLVLYISQTRTLVYWTGFILTEEEAAKLVKRMKACGERLHKINATARAEKDAARFAAWKAKGRKVVRI